MIKNVQAPREKSVSEQNFRLLSFGPGHLGSLPHSLSVLLMFEAGWGRKGLRVSWQEGTWRGGKGIQAWKEGWLAGSG